MRNKKTKFIPLFNIIPFLAHDRPIHAIIQLRHTAIIVIQRVITNFRHFLCDVISRHIRRPTAVQRVVINFGDGRHIREVEERKGSFTLTTSMLGCTLEENWTIFIFLKLAIFSAYFIFSLKLAENRKTCSRSADLSEKCNVIFRTFFELFYIFQYRCADVRMFG